MKKHLLGFILVLTVFTGLFSRTASAAASAAGTGAEGEKPYTRTIMMYDCGSNLEEDNGMASYNLRQILSAGFSKDDRVKFIIMTGGSTEWKLESKYLYDPETGEQPASIDPAYNQVWEAKGIDAGENPGKLVLLEKEGVNGVAVLTDPEEDREGESMSDPETLKSFINYCAGRYPAQKYDLILWDHGGGSVSGFGIDVNDQSDRANLMSCAEIADALSDNDVTKNGGRFDFINFDACLMGSVELTLAFADYMDYYIASPENVPGYGEEYSGWLDLLGEDPDMSAFEVGKKIVDDFIAFYDKPEGDGSISEGTLGVIDVKALMNSGFVETLDQLAGIMLREATQPGQDTDDYLFYDEFDSCRNSIQYGETDYYDLGTLITQMSYDFKELVPADIMEDGTVIDTNSYTETVDILAGILNDQDIVYARGTKGIRSGTQRYRDIYGHDDYGEAGTSGLYLYFPSLTKLGNFTLDEKKLKRVIETLPPSSRTDKRRDFLTKYFEAMVDYALISSVGRGVSEMLDSGTDRSRINYETFKEYMSKGRERVPYSEGAEDDPDWEGWDYFITPWGNRIIPLIMLRAGYEDKYNQPLDVVQAAEDKSKEWLDGVIRQQALENISRADTELERTEEEGGTGYRIRMENTGKRVVEDIRYTLTAYLPAVEEFVVENGYEDFVYDMDSVCEAEIGTVSGELLYETEEGEPVSGDSKADYVKWYLEPNGTWGLSPMEETWYAVRDADGYLHAADIQSEGDGSDEVWFYGYYTTKNGIKTTAALEFKGGDLTGVLLGSEDGNSFREIPVSEFTGEVEVMPMRREMFLLDITSVPLSKKTILLNKDTVGSIKVVRTDVGSMEDLRPDGADGDYSGLRRNIAIRDIYGYQIEYPLLHAGWNNYKGDWYYADKNGTLVKGWLTDNGNRYYTDPETGARQTGWKRIDGKKYYFMDSRCKGYTKAKEGAMQTGWKLISGKKYYFMDSRCKGYAKAKEGVVQTGFKLISGRRYYFMDSRCKGYTKAKEGILQTGWKNIGERRYYFMDSRLKGYKAAYEGVQQTGWKLIDGKKYYFMDERCAGYSTANAGSMATGLRTINGKRYYFYNNGVVRGE